MQIRPAPNRYELAAPFPSLPAITIDAINDGWGLANQTAKNREIQGRVLWIDGTANLESMGSAQSISQRIAQIANVGFNTIVYDAKPIVGYTTYPSRFTKKLLEWRGQKLDPNFDPLAAISTEARKNKLNLWISLNAFSEGHRLTRTGPGYERPEEQTVQYEADPIVRAPWPSNSFCKLASGLNPQSVRPDEIGVYSSKPANADASSWYVVADALGRVVSSSAAAAPIPEGGVILVARLGETGGDFLKNEVRIGSPIHFDTEARFVKAEDAQTQWPLMMNPHLRSVQLRAMSYAQEIASRYDVDGIMFDDRLRYGALNADFSESTRKEFEIYVGRQVKWPEDIYKVTITPRLARGIQPGKFYDSWLTWRALTLRNWIAEVRASLSKINQKVKLGIYAGSWFGEYDKFGSNYSSTDFSAGFPFLTDAYRQTGYANQLDLFIAGCYYRDATIAEAIANGKSAGRTVEAAGQLANRAIGDQCWTYAGLLLNDFAGNSRALEKAMQAAAATTQGVMIFDYSHNIDAYWPVFERAFAQRKPPPDIFPKLLLDIRKRRAIADNAAKRKMPVPIYEGSPGAGH